jgi:predicted CopG family antitoxin
MNVIAFMVTTISVSHETKERLKNLGRVGDTYEEVINRVLDINRVNILKTYLYDTSDSISIDEARRRLNDKGTN